MKFNKLFNLASSAYYGGSVTYKQKDKDKEDIVLKGSAVTQALHNSIQAFIYSAAQGDKTNKLQAFSGSSDLVSMTRGVFNVTMQTPNFDLNWQRAFKGIVLDQNQLSWEIATVDSGIVYKEIPEGGKIEYAGIGGEKVIVEVLKYGAGLGLTWETVEGKKLYKFVDALGDARAKLYNLWANIHYGLLAAASLVGSTSQVSWQGAETDTVLSRDVATLNEGANLLGEANKDKGYGDMANAGLLLYTAPRLRGRINAALKATSAEINLGREQGATGTKAASGIVDANIEPLYTYNASIPLMRGLLVLPGNKIQNASYMLEKKLSREDQDSLNKLIASWTAFGATVADTDQVFELDFDETA